MSFTMFRQCIVLERFFVLGTSSAAIRRRPSGARKTAWRSSCNPLKSGDKADDVLGCVAREDFTFKSMEGKMERMHFPAIFGEWRILKCKYLVHSISCTYIYVF